MRKLYHAIIVIVVSFLWSLCAQSQDFELVESIPIETMLDNPDIRNTHDVWLEMIGRAHRSLDIEQFYVSNEPGRLLEHILAAIYKAADRGVKVRFIVDARMYKTYPATVDSLGKYRNIETRRLDFSRIAGGIQHAKYFIVDGNEVFVGSQNFDWRALEHIHELGLRINNPHIAAIYGDVFNADWQMAKDTTAMTLPRALLEKQYRIPVRIAVQPGDSASVVPTMSPLGFIPESALWDERAIVDLINNAKRTLTLQFLSYSNSERKGGRYGAIDDAIRGAAKRGVKVRMIVADWGKGSSAVSALKDLSDVPNIEVAFTSIPEWSGGYVSFARVEHCKYIVADDTKFWLGTSNCEKSYFYSSRNLGIVCTDPHLAGTLSRIFAKSWNSPYKELITPDGEYKPREHGAIRAENK
jgi:phosphatidylserine/phosphatidylglycerophosphate/cardiolipin synthase-like enzyme